MANESKSKRDERSKALDSNPCGICRASGLPVCKGHGGGGEAKDENAPKDSAPIPKNVPSNVEVQALSSYLENSEVWDSEDDFLYYFNNDLAVFSIELDSAKGLIHFQDNKFLSASDEKDLNELYDRIKNEFEMFTDEENVQNMSLSREGNNLKINISDPKSYDHFVTRLLNKNLIPDNNYNADLVNKASVQKIDVNEAADSYKSPNPFDISKGPRPSNDD